MTKASAAVVGILMGILFIARANGAETAAGYKVVVNAANPVTTLSRDAVMRMFLKKTTSWPNGQPVAPVDQPTQASSHRAFCKAVLHRDTNEVAAYWNQMIFSGRAVPPPMRSSESEVLSYIRDNPNAIGYVAADAKIDEGVKVLTLRP
jgi:ABC-type phosphate transport system substrate-binding protein